jgi:hypothetical protein
LHSKPCYYLYIPSLSALLPSPSLHNELKQATFLPTQKKTKILCFLICVEDYHKLIQTQFLIQPPSTIWRPCSQKRRVFKLLCEI